MWDAIQETRDTEGRPVATLVSVVSEDERHTKGRTKRGRGRAARDRQLGRVQVKILRWLLAQEQGVEQHGSDEERLALSRRGVPWVKIGEKIGEHPSSVSEALRGKRQRSLFDRRLVSIRASQGGRITHVRLTASGRSTAQVVTPTWSPRAIEKNVSAQWEKHYGPRATWNPDVRQAFREQVERFVEVLRLSSQSLGTRPIQVTVEEFLRAAAAVGRVNADEGQNPEQLEFTWPELAEHLREYVKQTPEQTPEEE